MTEGHQQDHVLRSWRSATPWTRLSTEPVSKLFRQPQKTLLVPILTWKFLQQFLCSLSFKQIRF